MGFLRRKKKKVSEDGTKVDILMYEDDERKWQPPQESCVYLEEIERYINGIYAPDGDEGSIFHEILSDLVHIDVHVLPPAGERDFTVLYTTGMSDLPMTMPKEFEDAAQYERAELVMFLPADWQLGKTGEVDSNLPDEYFWPIHWIKFLARFPHEYHTFLGVGHTMPNGPDYEPVGEGTALGGFLFLPAPRLDTLTCADGAAINFLWAVPMYRDEIEFKLEHGLGAILDRLDKHKVPLPIDPHRPPIV